MTMQNQYSTVCVVGDFYEKICEIWAGFEPAEKKNGLIMSKVWEQFFHVSNRKKKSEKILKICNLIFSNNLSK